MPSIFTKIIRGEIASYKVAEDKDFLAFLDRNPLASGHTLVVPKTETDYIFDMDDDSIRELFVFAKRVAVAIEKVISCKRIGLTVIGLEVPHVHIHLIPINNISDMNFSMPKISLSDKELEKTAADISRSFQNLYPEKS